MVVELSVNHSEQNKIGKSLTDVLRISGNLTRETDVLKPSILIEITNPTRYNYMYIPEFARYYFISGITSVRTNLWRIDGEVDVLESFKDEILDCKVLVSDTTSTDESYMQGEQWKSLVKTKTDIINFPSGLNANGEYILITSGGVVSGS